MNKVEHLAIETEEEMLRKFELFESTAKRIHSRVNLLKRTDPEEAMGIIWTKNVLNPILRDISGELTDKLSEIFEERKEIWINEMKDLLEFKYGGWER